MYHKHHTKGIVIYSLSEGLSNRRIGLLTENLGLIWAKAQSARSGNSKLRAGCQDFSIGEFSLVLGKSGWRVVGARAESNLFEIFKADSQKLHTLANLFALVRKLVTGEDRVSDIFLTVSKFLDFLLLAKPEEVAPAEWLTLCRILRTLGFLREDPEVSPYLVASDIGMDELERITPMKNKIIRLINESLSVASAG